MSSTKAAVRLEIHPDDTRIATLRIDRPPLNALSQPMWDDLADAGRRLHESEQIRAVVITGGPEQFAAGADVKAMLDLSPAEFDQRNRILQGALHLIATAPQVTVAAISGYALGGGCELALAADFRFADGTAVLGLPEITLGIIPGSGGTQRLPRLIGPARAKELIFSGRPVRAAEAYEIGLVDRLVDAEVYDAALAQASVYARGPAALRFAKRAIHAADQPIELGLEAEADLISRSFATEDARIGISSFVEDGPRKAVFVGR